MSRKRALENPVDPQVEPPIKIRNQIDGEWMKAHFGIVDSWYWVPFYSVKMVQDLSRETKLKAKKIEKLKKKSVYKINVSTGKVYSTITNKYMSILTQEQYRFVRLHFQGKKSHKFYFHCLLCLMVFGLRTTIEHTVDHIDRNPANNSIENLRFASPSEQQSNKNPRKLIKISYIDKFKRKNYIKVKRIIDNGVIVPFKPNSRKKSVYLCKKGRHVVVNKRYYARIFKANGYPAIMLNVHTTVQLHRLMYINKHKSKSLKVVDHIDANKLNWAVDNLRECTQRENSLFAHREQLTTKNRRPITARNNLTNEEIEFPSVQVFIEQQHFTRDQLKWEIYEGNVIGNYTIIKAPERAATGKVRRVRYGDQMFDSISECARFIHPMFTTMNFRSLYRKMQDCLRKNKPLNGVEIEYVENDELPD